MRHRSLSCRQVRSAIAIRAAEANPNYWAAKPDFRETCDHSNSYTDAARASPEIESAMPHVTLESPTRIMDAASRRQRPSSHPPRTADSDIGMIFLNDIEVMLIRTWRMAAAKCSIDKQLIIDALLYRATASPLIHGDPKHGLRCSVKVPYIP